MPAIFLSASLCLCFENNVQKNEILTNWLHFISRFILNARRLQAATIRLTPHLQNKTGDLIVYSV